MKKTFFPLGFKIILIVAAISGLLLVVFSRFLISWQETELLSDVNRLADRLTETLRLTTYYDMLEDRRESVYRMMDSAGQLKGIVRIRIFNKEGRITYSSKKTEVGQVLNKESEACYNCHKRNTPLTRLDQRERTRVFQDPASGRVLGLIQPIYNERSCSEAPCHAHPPGKALLGVLDVHLSLADLDQALGNNRRVILRFTLLFIVIIPLVAWLFIYRFVHRPVKKLTLATARIAGGDLDVSIPARSRDEIGQLASSFNKMAESLRSAHDELQEWAGTLETRVKEKTRQLKDAQDQVIRSEKMAALGRLAAVVAHEINNPISGILTYTKLIRKIFGRDAFPDEKRIQVVKYLEIMEKETARCGRIVKELLAFSRGGASPLAKAQINDILDSVTNILSYKLALQKIEVKRELAPDLPPVQGNGDQLLQVVMSLIGNACDAMDEGGTLTLRSCFLPEQQQVEFRIGDTGPGIPDEIRETIFEPFVSTKTRGENLGLGLFVTSGIVQRHGGAITFESEIGKGAVFIITLPVAQAETGPG